jgi:hypothetical protein
VYPAQFHIPLYTGFPPRPPYNLCRRKTAARKREKIERKRRIKRGTRREKKKKDGG